MSSIEKLAAVFVNLWVVVASIGSLLLLWSVRDNAAVRRVRVPLAIMFAGFTLMFSLWLAFTLCGVAWVGEILGIAGVGVIVIVATVWFFKLIISKSGY